MGINVKAIAKLCETCGIKSILQTKPITKLETCGLKYAPKLESDLLVRNAKRWVGNAQKFEPTVFEGSMVSQHHELNGYNPIIRKYMESVKSGNVDEKLTDTKKYIEEVNNEFKNLPPIEKDCIVYRGRSRHPIIKRFNKDFDIVENTKVGDTIVPDEAYSYCGFKRSLADNWGVRGKDIFADNSKIQAMTMEIRLPKGAKVSRNLEHGGEVVMPQGSEYKLISKKLDKDGNMDLILEYILPKK